MLSMSARLAVASHKPPRLAPKYFAGVVELLIMPQGGAGQPRSVQKYAYNMLCHMYLQDTWNMTSFELLNARGVNVEKAAACIYSFGVCVEFVGNCITE